MKPLDANTNKQMLPDMEHKWKITRTWHELVDYMQDYITYKNIGKTKLSSKMSWTGKLTTIFLLTKYIKNENNEKINIYFNKLLGGNSLNDTELIQVTDLINKKLDALGLTNFDLNFEDPVTKYKKEFN